MRSAQLSDIFLLYKIAQNPKKDTSIYKGAITRIYPLLMDVRRFLIKRSQIG